MLLLSSIVFSLLGVLLLILWGSFPSTIRISWSILLHYETHFPLLIHSQEQDNCLSLSPLRQYLNQYVNPEETKMKPPKRAQNLRKRKIREGTCESTQRLGHGRVWKMFRISSDQADSNDTHIKVNWKSEASHPQPRLPIQALRRHRTFFFLFFFSDQRRHTLSPVAAHNSFSQRFA